ncbi:MAG TPA: response regulator transcription factor [Bryobacteraceae bacterium]|nr:response regulator transcription factor [Bryobacteraceae bacterium]
MVPIREPKTYSILLADDLTLIREGLAALCLTHPNLRVVGQCSEGVSALKQIEANRPDVAVLDLNLPDLHTLELVRRVREANLPTRIVVLSTKQDRKTVVEALRCGVNGFLLKSAPWTQLMEAFDQVLDGGIYISPEIDLNKILGASASGEKEDPLECLSAREHQVFSLLIEGLRNKEIASRLELSPKTVDTYRASLMRKLDIHDLAGLVKFAIRWDLTSAGGKTRASSA